MYIAIIVRWYIATDMITDWVNWPHCAAVVHNALAGIYNVWIYTQFHVSFYYYQHKVLSHAKCIYYCNEHAPSRDTCTHNYSEMVGDIIILTGSMSEIKS